ncbi:MAG: riboflavin synthase [Candidatus Kapabacteria bacterium]|jgi:riboflavin synthase|nr:riboflavin synthase [Candidatus Kapabacteria bacterium]
MFTGLVEEIGTIRSIEPIGNGKMIQVNASKVLTDVSIDASISVEGVCLTVVNFTSEFFEVIAVEETLKKTTLGLFTVGMEVNLERAVLVTDRLGGHIVQGHVDCTATVVSSVELTTSWEFSFVLEEQYLKYIIPVGSICINGTSLTVANISENVFSVAIIPHTYSATTIHNLVIGKTVNIEFDVIGKYVERMVQFTNK